jgi:hypothetical protein
MKLTSEHTICIAAAMRNVGIPFNNCLIILLDSDKRINSGRGLTESQYRARESFIKTWATEAYTDEAF